METALKISWINRIHQNSFSSWKILTEHFLRQHGGLSFFSKQQTCTTLIYQVILKHWQETKPIISEDDIKPQNEIILDYETSYKQTHDLFKIMAPTITFSDLLDNDFSFFSHTKFQQNFQLKIHLLWSNKRNSTKLEMRNQSCKRLFWQREQKSEIARIPFTQYHQHLNCFLSYYGLLLPTSNSWTKTSIVWFLQRRPKKCLHLSLCNNNRNKASNLKYP